MADFRTHVSTSTVLGIGYGGAAAVFFDMPVPACLLAGGLCSVAGMMPDLDSGPGRPLRESTAFAAAVVPMLLIDRFRHAGMSTESMVLAGAGIYLGIRFGVHWLLSRYTVHRGMFHSLPAALIAVELTMLICSSHDLNTRYFMAGGVLLGFMSHLILDELWSVEWYRGRMRFKKSFGTAIKLWSDSMWANFSTYAKVFLLAFLLLEDPILREQFEQQAQHWHQVAGGKVKEMLEQSQGLSEDEQRSSETSDRQAAGYAGAPIASRGDTVAIPKETPPWPNTELQVRGVQAELRPLPPEPLDGGESGLETSDLSNRAGPWRAQAPDSGWGTWNRAAAEPRPVR